MSNDKRFCKKCLLLQYSEADYFKNLYEYINTIDEELKVNDTEYDRRLNLCVECPDYFQGMCRVCGCFVELRAALIENECAAPMKRW